MRKVSIFELSFVEAGPLHGWPVGYRTVCFQHFSTARALLSILLCLGAREWRKGTGSEPEQMKNPRESKRLGACPPFPRCGQSGPKMDMPCVANRFIETKLGAMSHACVGMLKLRENQFACPRKRGTWHPCITGETNRCARYFRGAKGDNRRQLLTEIEPCRTPTWLQPSRPYSLAPR